jgi:hypothetical protein
MTDETKQPSPWARAGWTVLPVAVALLAGHVLVPGIDESALGR